MQVIFSLLSNSQMMMSIVTTIAFVLAAWMSISPRPLQSLIRTVGFLMLASWTATTSFSFSDQTLDSTLMLAGSLLITVGFITDRMAVVSRRKEGPDKKDVLADRITAVLDKKPVQKEAAGDIQKENGVTPVKPAAERKVPEATRKAVNLKAGLRTEPLVKLPSERRKKARSVVNVLVGILILALVGWGSYAIAKRILQSKTDFDSIKEQVDELIESPQEEVSVETKGPVEESTPEISESSEEEVIEEEIVTEDSGDEVSPEETTSEEKKMITISETETGYLNVREGASTATRIVTQVNPGETYELREENEAGTWAKIKIDNETEGWVNNKYIEKETE